MNRLKFRVLKWEISQNVSGVRTFSANIVSELDHDVDPHNLAKKIEETPVMLGRTLDNEAIEILEDEIAKLKARHKEQIETLLKTQSLQTLEIRRLRQIEDSLNSLIGAKAGSIDP